MTLGDKCALLIRGYYAFFATVKLCERLCLTFRRRNERKIYVKFTNRGSQDLLSHHKSCVSLNGDPLICAFCALYIYFLGVNVCVELCAVVRVYISIWLMGILIPSFPSHPVPTSQPFF